MFFQAFPFGRAYPLMDVTLTPWSRAKQRLSTEKGLVMVDGRPLMCAARWRVVFLQLFGLVGWFKRLEVSV